MNSTCEQPSGYTIRLIVVAAAITIGLAVWLLAQSAVAYEGPLQAGVDATPLAQASSGPEANLPYLFAVYIITWAAFFAYVFYVSRRQREMQGEIEALKRALEERDGRAVEHNSGPGSAG